jgi:hypothetical protein
MSQQNVEIVRRLNAAFNRSSDEWLEFYDSSAEIQLPPGLFEDRVGAGREDIRRAAALWTETVDAYHWEMAELIDAGDECVVGLSHFRSRINGGGAWLKPRLGVVFYLRDAKIVRVLAYFSWAEALQAAGVHAGHPV